MFELKGAAEQDVSMDALSVLVRRGLENEHLPACGACADDVTQTLAPGESYTTTWDGDFFYHYDSGARSATRCRAASR